MNAEDPPTGLDTQAIYPAIFNAYPDALLLVDAQGRIGLVNPAACRLLGYTPEQLVGLNVDVLVPEGIRPRHAQYREAYARQPRQRPMGTQMDLVARRCDGSEVMVEIALSPLHDQQPPMVVVAIRGIGDYPRVKQALRRARYSECVAQVGRMAVDARDPHQLLQQVPPMAAEALQVPTAVLFLLEPDRLEFRVAAGVGLLPGEGIGTRMPNQADTPAGFVLAAGRPMALAADATGLLQARLVAAPAHDLAAGLVSALGVPLYDRGQPIGVLTVRSNQPQRFGDDEVRFLESLSNLLTATLQRIQTEETLNHSQRMESVGQLTGGIAHDFNNLLTVIQGNLQVLEELPLLAGQGHAQQLVAAATRASKRGAELTRKLLAFSRRQVLSPSRIDVQSLLHSLADMLRRTLDQRIHIEVQAEPNCPAGLADAGQLESALLNIAINARDAMPSGGTLDFACHPVSRLPAELADDFAANSPRPEGYVAIAITDTGAGMSEAVKERAFEPFFTTKESGRGTGLGLSTVYGFIRQSKGAITLDSAPGRGTTVTLYIPQDNAALTPATALDSPAELAQGLHVMLVEDEAEVREVTLQFLSSLGCVVSGFANAEEALQAIEPPGGYDLLLSDVALGTGMRGTELAQQMRVRWPGIAVLLVSGYSAELLDLDQTAPASWQLLGKPFSRSELQGAMQLALAWRGAPD